MSLYVLVRSFDRELNVRERFYYAGLFMPIYHIYMYVQVYM